MKSGTEHSAARLLCALSLSVAISLAAADPLPAEPQVQLGPKTFRVTIADTGEARRRGLSGRTSLPRERGLLFVFERDGYHRIWMKDMRFSIDVVWIDSSGLVVHVERGLSPDSYPQAFVSPTPARYVLEVTAGESEGVRPGTPARFGNMGNIAGQH